MKIMICRRKPTLLKDPRNVSYGILNIFGVSHGTPAALRADAEASPSTLEPTRAQGGGSRDFAQIAESFKIQKNHENLANCRNS